MTDLRSLFATRLEGSLRAIASLRESVDRLVAMADVIAGRVRSGGTVYTCGNGGSAAEALHFAEELLGRYRGQRPAIRAMCLNADPTAITCIANDFGFEQVFARQCEAMLTPGDVLVAFSTSGESPNVALALDAARRRGAATLGLLGRTGGRCAALCDAAVIVPADDAAHIQEAHQAAMHLLCEALEGCSRAP